MIDLLFPHSCLIELLIFLPAAACKALAASIILPLQKHFNEAHILTYLVANLKIL